MKLATGIIIATLSNAVVAQDICTVDMLAGVWRVEAPYQGVSCDATLSQVTKRQGTIIAECGRGDERAGKPHGTIRVRWDQSGAGCIASISLHSANSTRESGTDSPRIRWAYAYDPEDGTFDPYIQTTDLYDACQVMGAHHAAQSGYRLASTEVLEGIRPQDGSSVIVQNAGCVWQMDRGVSLPFQRVSMSTSAICQSLRGTHLPQDQCYGNPTPDEWIYQPWSITAESFVDSNSAIIEDGEAVVRIADELVVEQHPFRAERVAGPAVRPE